MKRTPLNRYTELKRKKPIRKMSDKKRQEIDETGPWRKAYVDELGICQCGECSPQAATDCHEIPSGPDRTIAVWLPDTYLALSRKCHDRIQSEPLETQVARKIRCVFNVINSCLGSWKRLEWSKVMSELRRMYGG